MKYITTIGKVINNIKNTDIYNSLYYSNSEIFIDLANN